MTRYLLALTLFLSPALAQATCPTYFYPQATVYAPTYVPPAQKFYQTFYVFTPGLAVGLTSSGYGPAPTEPAAAPSPCSAEIKTLRAEIERLKASIAPPVAPQSPTAPPMAPVGERPSGSAIVRLCASCHDSAVAKTAGGGVELTAFGQELKYSASMVGKIMQATNPVKGTMPKGKPHLSGDEYNEIVKALIVQQSQ